MESLDEALVVLLFIRQPDQLPLGRIPVSQYVDNRLLVGAPS
jgi:hypothetical protein